MLNTREEKLNFLKSLGDGTGNINQLKTLEPFGIVIFQDGFYCFNDGRKMNEDEFQKFYEPYRACNDETIYCIIIRTPDEVE